MTTSHTNRRPYGSGALYVKAGSYYGRWRAHGRQVNRKLGPVRQPGSREGLTRAMAERELRRRMESERIPTGAQRLTLAEAVERKIAASAASGAKPVTLYGYRSLAHKHLGGRLGARDLERVAPEDLERLVAGIRGSGGGPHLVHNVLQLVTMTYRHAMKRGWCASNPVDKLERGRPRPPAETRTLDLGELEVLLRGLPDTDTGRRDRVFVLASALAGLRMGELLALRWRDVDWLAGRLRVQRNYVHGHLGTPKSGKARSVPLAARLAAELEGHSRRSHYTGDDDLVFPNDLGGPLDDSALRKRLKTAIKRAGIRPLRFHDLRRTFATRAAAAGAPPRLLQEWLGHSDLSMVARYADYVEAPAETAWLERAFRQEP